MKILITDDERRRAADLQALLTSGGFHAEIICGIEQLSPLGFGNTRLDPNTGILSCGGSSVRLSARELDVMRLLLHSGERSISKNVILERVWGYDSGAAPNHVEVYVGFLRKKLRAIGSDLRITAIRNRGYHLETAPA